MTLSLSTTDAPRNPRGFQIAVYPGSTSRPANWLDDTFYVTLRNEGYYDPVDNPPGAMPAEPVLIGEGFGQYLRKYRIVSTAGLPLLPNQGSYPGSFSIDVSQLPYPGAQYYVVGFRHYNDGTPKERFTLGSYWNHNLFATQDTRREMAHRTVWVEDWSKGFKDWTTDGHVLYPDHVMVGQDPTVGNFARLITQSGALRSGVVWRHDRPWTIKAKLRQVFARHWSTLTVMMGEASYLQITTNGGTIGWVRNIKSPDAINLPFTGYTSGSGGQHVLNTWREFEIRGDGAGNITMYVDGTLVNTTTADFVGALSVWLGHVVTGGSENGSTFAYADHGPVTVTGDFDVWGISDSHSNKAYASSSDYGVQMGSEYHLRPAGINFYGNAGGITRHLATDFVSGQDQGSATDHWTTGSFQANTPAIFKGPGQSYSSLKLAGNTRAHGSLIAYVRRFDGSLVPDSEIPGNSAGFSPSGTGDTSISLTGVTTDGIYVDLQGSNTLDNTVAPPVWQKAEIQLAYSSTQAALVKDYPVARDLTSGPSPVTEVDEVLPLTYGGVATPQHISLTPVSEIDVLQTLVLVAGSGGDLALVVNGSDGNSRHPQDISGGHVLARGDEAVVDLSNPHEAALLESDILVIIRHL